MDEEDQKLRLIDLGSELSELCSEVMYELDARRQSRSGQENTEKKNLRYEYITPPVL